MANEEAMVIACTSLVFCALDIHARNIKKQKHAAWLRDYLAKTVFNQGQNFSGSWGIIPLKYLSGGDKGAFIPPTPQYSENDRTDYHSKRLREREDMTPATDRHTRL